MCGFQRLANSAFFLGTTNPQGLLNGMDRAPLDDSFEGIEDLRGLGIRDRGVEGMSARDDLYACFEDTGKYLV